MRNEINNIESEPYPPEGFRPKNMRHVVIQNILKTEDSNANILETLSFAWFNLQGYYGKIVSLKGKVSEEDNNFEIEIDYESYSIFDLLKDPENHTTTITGDESTWGLYKDLSNEEIVEYRNRLEDFSQYLVMNEFEGQDK